MEHAVAFGADVAFIWQDDIASYVHLLLHSAFATLRSSPLVASASRGAALDGFHSNSFRHLTKTEAIGRINETCYQK